MHAYTWREKREEEMREGALSVQSKINAHYRNIKCTKEGKKKTHCIHIRYLIGYFFTCAVYAFLYS